jgi:hypothetical protein
MITDSLSGVDPTTAAFAVVDEYGSVQPQGPVTLGSGGSFSFQVLLQASRNENDQDGRQYTVTISARDYAGNLGSSAKTVTVPHDRAH